MAQFIPPRFRIHQIGDPILRLESERINDVDDEIVATVKRMKRANKYAGGVGVCGPQVGVLKRLFVWNARPIGKGVIINPEVVETHGSISVHEGCLSIPGFYYEIERPASVHVKGTDLDGNDVEIEATDLMARLVLHEVDHLDGILMVDRLSDEQWGDFESGYKKRYGYAPPGDWRQELGARAGRHHWTVGAGPE
jgi:peptide deformylase